MTSTTPTGWTLPTGGSAVNNTGLYLWTRTAAGGDTFSTTHNASNYPAVFDIYEFEAGSTLADVASATGVSPAAGAGPTISSLSGTNWTAGIVGQDNSSATTAFTMSWDLGTEEVDTSVLFSSTDGYTYSLTYDADNTASSAAYAATSSAGGGSATVERLVAAVNIGASEDTLALKPVVIVA